MPRSTERRPRYSSTGVASGGLALDAATDYVQPRRYEVGVRFEF